MRIVKVLSCVIGLVLGHVAASVGTTDANGAVEADWTRGYDACVTEDARVNGDPSDVPCYWNAERRGNGDGNPSTFNGYNFIATADGRKVVYPVPCIDPVRGRHVTERAVCR